MGTITFDNISVSGIEFNKILEINITHNVNEHAKAVVRGEVDYEKGKESYSRMSEKDVVKITTSAEGQPPILFCGVVSNAGINYAGDYAVLELNLISSSYMLDIKKNKKSFQNTGMTYEQILNSILAGKANLNFEVTDKAIGSLIMQYNETDWEFIKRMAAVFNAPVITSVTSEIPDITIGIPIVGGNQSIGEAEFTYGINGEQYSSTVMNSKVQGNVMQEDFAGTSAVSYQYGFLGQGANCGGNSQKVKGVSCSLVDGILKTNMNVANETAFVQPTVTNKQSSGRMFKGTVKAVKLDKVQVHITDIDPEYDGGGTYWFPYSTAYSSSDGSGFYCMPEVGDTVRVFFPSDKEGDAFAASSVNVSPLDNPKHKKWKNTTGKEILMTEEGLFITCMEKKIFINLLDDEGITIYSEKNIYITTTANMNIKADKELIIESEKSISLGTGESNITMDKEKITIGASNLLIN